jgi:hypothetical protein
MSFPGRGRTAKATEPMGIKMRSFSQFKNTEITKDCNPPPARTDSTKIPKVNFRYESVPSPKHFSKEALNETR